MPRGKTEKTKRREELLTAFNALEPIGQRFALDYTQKLLELQELDELVSKVRGYKADGTEHCSFCGKTKDEVGRLIMAQDGIGICDECVKLCTEVLEDVKK